MIPYVIALSRRRVVKIIPAIRRKKSKDSLQEKRAVISAAEKFHISELFTSSIDRVRFIKAIRATVKTGEIFENEIVLDLIWI